MLSRVSTTIGLLRLLGPRWAAFRLVYAARMKTGLIERRMRAHPWAQRPLHMWLRDGVPAEAEAYAAWRSLQGGRFLFRQLPQNIYSAAAVAEAESILVGHWHYFGLTPLLVGFPPVWNANPLTGVRVSNQPHWSRMSDFAGGDIKFIWEASRFGVVYPLARAYASTGDDRYAEAFWRLVEDWAVHNPPQQGANWKCGQETTFRVMAWCFGLYAFAASPQTTSARVAAIAAMIAVQAERIASNIAYARSQKNNHAVSEAVGLWTAGLLFPEFAAAAHWRAQGKHELENEIRRQVYADGSYVQHSLNYHRLMLHDCVWALRLGEVNGDPLADDVIERIGQAAEFLYQLVDLATGQVPNMGANDGAHILPLSDGGYRDFRPALQAAYAAVRGRRLLEAGPWDEALVWLGLDALPPAVSPPPQHNLNATTGGVYTRRAAQSWVLLRCVDYRDRPSHADQLHVDVWWRGQNIACDAGTYRYNAPAPWDNGLARSAVHNTITVDDQDQMTRVSRFMWVNWARGRVLQSAESPQLTLWEGEHDGYCRLTPPVLCRRAVVGVDADTWLIVDTLMSARAHRIRLHWLLADFPYRQVADGLILATPQGDYYIQAGCSTPPEFELVRADPQGTRGWRSLSYGHKIPAISWSLTVSAAECQFWTVLGPHPCEVASDPHKLVVRAQNWCLHTELGGERTSAYLTGAPEERLP
jgi:asparagine synthase (glutamine-hydrolysing)